MNDKVEKFIKSHRAEMDFREPRPDLWIDITNEINDKQKQKSFNRSFILWRAAAVLLLLVSTWLVVEKFTQQPVSKEIVVNEELREAEAFYVSLIGQKRQEVLKMSEELGLGGEFENEINALDSMYVVLKDDLKNGNEENVVDAMILNLQLRIEILNRQLSIIQTIENSRKENNKEDETIRL
jgi:hypothetical protein